MRSPLVLCSVLLSLVACSKHHSGGSPPPGQILGFVGFDARVELALGVDAAEQARAVDLDGDGLADLVAVDRSGRLAVRFGQGGGAFATGRIDVVSADAFEVLVGDLDATGSPDLVVVGRTGSADVLLNDGNGTLTLSDTLAIGSDALDAALADVTGDDVLDLVVVHAGGTDVVVLEGVGDGFFVSPTMRVFDRSGEVTGLSTGDLDGDGVAEIVCCDVTRNRIAILPGDGSAAIFVAVGNQPVASAVGDVTSDGTLEIVVALLGDRRVDVLGRTPSGWSPVQALETSGQPFDLTVADVDSDGAADLVYTLIDDRAIAIHHAVGQALQAEADMRVATGAPIAPQIVDVDGDGQDDLFVPGFGIDRACLFPGRAGGFGGGRLNLVASVPSPEIVQAAHIDTDGQLEVLASSFWSNFLSISNVVTRPDGRIALERATQIDFGRPVQNVVPADLDQDGLSDFVVPVEGGIKLVRNRGPIANFLYNFEILPSASNDLIAPGDGPFEVVVEDVDGDGHVDLVVAYHQNDKVALLRGSGTPFEFLAPEELTVSGMPVGMATGDFDGDGALEIGVARLSQATVTVLEVTAAGLAIASDTPVGPSPFQLRSADFDNDGRSDLVVSESGAQQVTMLIAVEGGGFRALSVDAGRSPTALAIRDLNRDGTPDILVASLVGADFRVLLGDGLGGVAQALVFPGVYGALTAAVADLDGDGFEDISIGSLESEGIAVFRNVSRVE